MLLTVWLPYVQGVFTYGKFNKTNVFIRALTYYERRVITIFKYANILLDLLT